MMANTWQGRFPWENLKSDRYEGTSPVGVFPPNGYELYDATGNVWEWTSDYFSPRHPEEGERPCCVPKNPRVDSPEGSHAVGEAGAHIPRRVTKGGSHLCAPNYCLRYRPAARQAEAVDTSTTHIGFAAWSAEHDGWGLRLGCYGRLLALGQRLSRCGAIGLIVDLPTARLAHGLHVRKECQHRTNRSGEFADVDSPKKPTRGSAMSSLGFGALLAIFVAAGAATWVAGLYLSRATDVLDGRFL
jgi:Sulfatase-modifying factor enzyme 1